MEKLRKKKGHKRDKSLQKALYRPLSVFGEKGTQAAIIYEQAIDKTTELIISNLSWANAALLALALPNTIEVSDWSDLGNAWFYFIIIFISSVLLAILPRTWEEPQEVLRELELKMPIKLAKQGDIGEQAKLEEKKQAAQARGRESRALSDASKIFHFVEVEADAVGENFEDLLILTIGNVVAMSLRDAAKETFEDIIGEDDDSLTTTAYMFYAMFVTIVSVIFTLKLGVLYAAYEKQIYQDIKEQGIVEAKDEMMLFAVRKRCLKLTMAILALCMAWSWRDAFSSLILAMTTGDADTVANMWIYCLTTTCFVTFTNALCNQYILLYPRSDEVKNLQLGTESRKLLSTMFSNNVKYICAFAWYDAISESFDSLNSWESWQKTLFYWFTAISLQIGSYGLKFVWAKYSMKIKIAEYGLAHAFLQGFGRIFDPHFVQHEDISGGNDSTGNTSTKKPVIVDDGDTIEPYFYLAITMAFGDLFIYALGTASSLFITLSLKYTIAAAYSDIYDSDDSDDVDTGVWALWVALLISIAVSTFIVTYFSRLINKIKANRKKLFEEDKAKKQEIKKQQMETIGSNDDNDDDITSGDRDVQGHSGGMVIDEDDDDDEGDDMDNNHTDSLLMDSAGDGNGDELKSEEVDKPQNIDAGLGMAEVALDNDS